MSNIPEAIDYLGTLPQVADDLQAVAALHLLQTYFLTMNRLGEAAERNLGNHVRFYNLTASLVELGTLQPKQDFRTLFLETIEVAVSSAETIRTQLRKVKSC